MQGVGYRINMLLFGMLKFLKLDFCYLKQVNLTRNLLIRMNMNDFFFVVPFTMEENFKDLKPF